MDVYIKIIKSMLIIIEVYVDDIIFGSDDDRLSQQLPRTSMKLTHQEIYKQEHQGVFLFFSLMSKGEIKDKGR